MKQPLISAIVSTYNAERFILGCLNDLVAQSVFHETEVIVIDSGSQQGEGRICGQFASRYPQIRVIRTEREPLYVAWNRALPIARGKYITNANTDDRHHPDFLEKMTAILEQKPEVALAYADQYVSHTENETYSECVRRGARIRRWPVYTKPDLILRCITGSQPVWRRRLHDEFGYFDTAYRIAADYDMWLSFSSRYTFEHVDEVLGVFFDSPETISGVSNRVQVNRESLLIKKKHTRELDWNAYPGLRKRVAAHVFGMGYQHISHGNDVEAACPFFLEALRLDPFNFSFLKTYLYRCVARAGN